jgi:hypothetical protein
MDFNERKNVLRKLINEKAKEMTDNLATFPDSTVKDEFLGSIEEARKKNLRLLDELTKF